MDFLLVFLGAGLGGVMRHAVNLGALRSFGANSFPFGTLGINVVGSFAMGVVVQYFIVRAGLPQTFRLFLTTGVIGGFTTFSTFSLETALLIERGQSLHAGVYAAASVVA